ncbi:Pyruvate:ferredoxin oxidoreductase, beta subunit [Pyrodictium delaneyi]|uniref:2-oxoacid oxidoreductase (ferredoxin) n=1 Tax=Pyrodictium delaneyi TaxID=1273541 RepID=A0A0P0N0F8_9CREN|nr:pyruvate synthase subunit PorB [Pyrodictium delaneyi]ALL00317.1 Pyruvate:ferredoxin oxidoreductase, beta subunit [Pyrodictium delaneyi]OWJ54465.1 pyruvate ferredoxin oxidoreductase [Pyrodictium delaneyi]
MALAKPVRTVWDIPREERFAPGHSMCQGCGAALIMRHLMKVLGKDAIIAMATGCVEVTTTLFPRTSWKNPWIHLAFENAGAVASGIEAAIKALQRKGVLNPDRRIKVVAIAGDGGTFDIGLQSLSGMLERGHDVMYVVYDNEAYMNTGIQRSGATPLGAWTTTTPIGKRMRGEMRPKKDIIGIALAHRIPYIATANPAYPTDMIEKFRKAFETRGPSLVHVLSPCTPGWRIKNEHTIEVARLAVQTGMWVQLEIENGKPRVTVKVPKRKHVRHYLKLQGRFRHLTDEEIEQIQRMVDQYVEEINRWVGEEAIGPVVE